MLTQGVFLDISSAFDKVWHNGLLSKLEQIGVENNVLDLFTSHLKDRKQTVVEDGITTMYIHFMQVYLKDLDLGHYYSLFILMILLMI